MARRRQTSMIEDVWDICVSVPWWGGVAVAALFWGIGLYAAGRAADNALMKGAAPLVKMFFGAFSLVALVAAAVSFIKGLSRRQLLDRQVRTQFDGQPCTPSILSLSWREFEQLVGEAYRRQGYDVEETGGGGADGGIDLVLRGHGETVLVQCKQWRERQVGVDKVRELFGVVTAEGANRGILVTSGTYTNDAQSFKVGKPLILVDGPALAELVENVQTPRQVCAPSSANPAAVAYVPPAPRTTPTCPRCNSPMALRTAKRGASAGKPFYGCTRYPGCKGTRPAD